MNKITFYVGQVPVERMAFIVVDEGKFPRNLTAYSGAEVLFTDPDGEVIQGGAATFADREGGIVSYQFPSTTIFTKRGQYGVQVKLTAGQREDYTDVETIHVIKALEA